MPGLHEMPDSAYGLQTPYPSNDQGVHHMDPAFDPTSFERWDEANDQALDNDEDVYSTEPGHAVMGTTGDRPRLTTIMSRLSLMRSTPTTTPTMAGRTTAQEPSCANLSSGDCIW
jgi:hypothetical protein